MEVLEKTNRVPAETDVVDIGAGMGALSRRLSDKGYRVRACELFPEYFRVPEVECRKVEADGNLPFEDASIDVAFAVELVEHIETHKKLFNETARILKPGGEMIITTPNVLSFKSRIKFLFTGYLYSFPPLEPDVLDPVRQHITPLTLDMYRWRLAQSGFEIVGVDIDKVQGTSLGYSFLLPIVWLATWRASRRAPNVTAQNQFRMLFGRTMILTARRL
ncbi:MAG: class I SAM-dependent methyltransferase [Woeseiaceae bacterium]|nr:class I SAM-dependent methyltransferase [Woeseiaceae bacterium]